MNTYTPKITLPLVEKLKKEGQAAGLNGKMYPFTEYMSVDEGNILYQMIRASRPKTVLEIGMGMGLGSLYILQALADNGNSEARLISVEQSQDDGWTGVALNNIKLSGLEKFHLPLISSSEYALPGLLSGGAKWDMALIDSNHQFDQTMVEAYFVNRGLSVHGSILFHDINLLSIQSVCNFYESNLGYQVDPINFRTPPGEMGALKVLTKTQEDTRPWFHFVPFTVPAGDQMSAYNELLQSQS